MDRVYQSNASSTPTAVPSPGSHGFVQSDVPLPSFDPTDPGPFFFFWLTESYREVIVAAGLTPDPTNLGQFAQAVIILAQEAAGP